MHFLSTGQYRLFGTCFGKKLQSAHKPREKEENLPKLEPWFVVVVSRYSRVSKPQPQSARSKTNTQTGQANCNPACLWVPMAGGSVELNRTNRTNAGAYIRGLLEGGGLREGRGRIPVCHDSGGTNRGLMPFGPRSMWPACTFP